MTRARGSAIAAVLLLACADRLASEPHREALCIHALGTIGHWSDGTQSLILDPDAGTPYVCTCVTEAEFWSEDDLAAQIDDLNDRMLEECERVGAEQGFEWTECQLDHDARVWTQWHFFDAALASCGEGWLPDGDSDGPTCTLGSPGCSCTVDATCTGAANCIDGMCHLP
ncbi:hypothetical protein ACNOYE_12090 [Nannocystaceae bacterium ST9]